MENWKRLIKKNTKLDYIARVVHNWNDPEFIEQVRAIKRDPNLLYFKKYGNGYPQISFYNISLDYPSKGFFALLMQTLDALRYADRFGLTSVVTWSGNCLYKEEDIINGTHNPFEYYFEPISPYTINDLTEASRVLEYAEYHRSIDKEHTFGVASKTIIENDCYDSYINENAAIFKKYLKIKKNVLKEIECGLNKIGFTNKILGIHVRATDFSKGYINHAKLITQNEYIDIAIEAMNTGKFEKIFLATDENSVVNEFKKKFGDKLIYYQDVFRSDDGNAIHFSQSNRKNHKYYLGLEVLRDMYTLAKCDGLIGGFSNVCLMAQIVHLSWGYPFTYLNVINKGFNTSGQTTYQDHFKK